MARAVGHVRPRHADDGTCLRAPARRRRTRACARRARRPRQPLGAGGGAGAGPVCRSRRGDVDATRTGQIDAQVLLERAEIPGARDAIPGASHPERLDPGVHGRAHRHSDDAQDGHAHQKLDQRQSTFRCVAGAAREHPLFSVASAHLYAMLLKTTRVSTRPVLEEVSLMVSRCTPQSQ